MIGKISNTVGRALGRGPKPARAWRPQWLPREYQLIAEPSAHPHDPIERAELFLAFNAGSTEMEVLNWLYSTILLLKPQNIVETGAADGLGTLALAAACKANGFGTVHSVELDPGVCAKAQERIGRAGLTPWVKYHCMDAQKFLRETDVTFELGFFDSLCELRAKECEICMERGILRGPAIFHDTSPYRTRTLKDWPREPLHQEFRRDMAALATRYFEGNFTETALSRGLTMLFPKRYPLESK